MSLNIFLRFTPSLADKFEEVNKRLISAFGIDTSNDNVRVEWDQYLSLKCFLELFTLRGEELQNVWLKALDPRGLAIVPKKEFQNFLEQLARGAMSESPTAVSEVFSQEMMRLMQLEDCMTENGQNIDMHNLRKKIKDGVIDVEIFNQLLKQDCLFKVESVNHKID